LCGTDWLPQRQQPHYTDNAATAQLFQLELKQFLPEQFILQQPILKLAIVKQPELQQRVIQ
jgi:hypothetical protein